MLDLTKPVRTKDGQEVRIYATDAGGTYPIHGAMAGKEGRWVHYTWTLSGSADVYSPNHAWDLVNVPERVRVHRWINVQRAMGEPGGVWARLYVDREAAEKFADPARLACYELDVELREGHGL